MSFLLQFTSFSGQKGSQHKTSSFLLRRICAPLFPMVANFLYLTGSSFPRRVLNFFVQPTHSGRRFCSYPGLCPIKYVLATLLCFVIAREHSCNPTPIEFTANVICYSMCFFIKLFPV